MKFIFMLLVTLPLSIQAKEKCYNLKEFMQDEKLGKSKICLLPGEPKTCLFTSDEGWALKTFKVPCSQFDAFEKKIKLLKNL